MPPSEPVWQTLQHYAVMRFQQFGDTSFADLHAGAESFYQVPDAMLDFMLRRLDSVWQWLDRCVTGRDARLRTETLRFFVEQMTGYVHRRNQFIVVGAGERRALQRLYGRFLVDFRDALWRAQQREDLRQRISRTLMSHRDDLEGFVARLSAANGGALLLHSEPTASTYSPALQLQVFGVGVRDLREPVLDLGCGADARLVAYLRDHGLHAAGVERAPSALPYVAQADWLDLDLGMGQWGTVISHMAFSTQFLHHHLRPDGHAAAYARRYMDVLNALAPGGSFLYTPGLPFIEAMLDPARFHVHQRAIPSLAEHPIRARLQMQIGADVLYACRVTRV